MTPLIDGDVLRYEVGFAAEVGWQGEGIPTFDYVEKVLLERIAMICRQVKATTEPIIFLTGDNNFRNEIAVTKVYKGSRKSNKPWHWHNLTAYFHGNMDVVLVDGLEADDMMAIIQTIRNKEVLNEEFQLEETIICSRDKDLRQVPGWGYSWELGAQPSFGPEKINKVGSIYLERREKKPPRIKGTGLAFFYSQCLTGDVVDNIPGLPKCGAVKAFDILQGRETPESLLEGVCGAYKEVYWEDWEEKLTEQGQLLWMVRELDADGKPVMWHIGKEE